MLRPLVDSLNRSGFELDIICRSEGNDVETERSFCESILGQTGWTFVSRQMEEKGSYKVLSKYPLSLSAGSALGLEALSCQLRVMFLDMSSAAPFRNQFWYPSETSLSHSPLLLREEDVAMWGHQISALLDLDDNAFSFLAEGVVGKGPLTTSLDDIQSKIKVMLSQSDLGKTSNAKT